MKRSIVLAAAIALASPAAAEGQWELGTSGNWAVDLAETAGGSMTCVLSSLNRRRDGLSLLVDTDGDYFLFLATQTNSSDPYRTMVADIKFHIYSGDEVEKWQLYDANWELEDGVISAFFNFGADPAQRNFVADFMEGDTITLLNDEGAYASWSLEGSVGGVKLLDDCRQRIVGEPL
tara:strand:- start:1853 stop:2383 length:531 start_codon:yes stop_codon:yes gene_type:complete